MKKMKLIILSVMILVYLSACESNNEKETKKDTEKTNQEDIQEVIKNTKEDDIIDLTKLSDSMVYAQLYVILTKPEEHLGKTIKIKGEYYEVFNEVTNANNFYVITTDEAQCCQTGLEFVIKNESIEYPKDYPKANSTIEITGIFTKGYDNGSEYYYLLTDKID